MIERDEELDYFYCLLSDLVSEELGLEFLHKDCHCVLGNFWEWVVWLCSN